MPRVIGTRKQRAAELLKRATNGPAFDMTFSEAGLSDEQKAAIQAELRKRYQCWSQTWLLPALTQLVPELRQAQG